MDKYDYIIAGMGAAGLSLLVHMAGSAHFTNKKILVVDREAKDKNDRTWCFWEKGAGLFEPVVYRRWSSMWFHDKKGSALHDISPYQYKLIRGIDFYNYSLGIISAQPNVTVIRGNVDKCASDATGTFVSVDGRMIFAEFIFNSILFGGPLLSSKNHLLLQHFRGWTINAPVPAFDDKQATLMDFRITQVNGDTTFVYVMPFSKCRALVEFTVFSKNVLADEAYDESLRHYCSQYLGIGEYEISDTESGVIPMTDHKFQRRQNNIIHIGTAGGQTKPSSGYTFNFIQKHSTAIVKALISTGKPFVNHKTTDKKFGLYDRVLLTILSDRSLPGEDIFSILMRSNRMQDVFKFLDNETSLAEELKIIRKLPKGIFLRAALGM